MAKGKFQGTTMTSDSWSPKQAHALTLPFPDGLDQLFRQESDAEDDFVAAYQRAIVFTVALGDTRVAYLWQQALKIGFRAGRGHAAESVRDREASEDFALGREAGLKEGRTGGLRDGKQDGRKSGKNQGLKEGEAIGHEKGLAEGKRLGFIAGREFGEKQATKLSKDSVPARVLVDIGTDSPAEELSLRPPPSPSISTRPAATALVPVRETPFSWADESCSISVPENTNTTPFLPPRDFSVLRSASSPTPFGTLRYRAHRTQKSVRGPRCSAMHPVVCTRHHAPTFAYGSADASKPVRVAPTSRLAWESDPRLSDLSRVLRSMGWTRGGGGSS